MTTDPKLTPIAITDPAEAGATLRTLRIGRGLTQDQLAQATAKDQSQLSGWEHGRRAVGLRSLLALADALGYDLALIPREDSDA